MATPQLYPFEREIVIVGDCKESDFAGYVGASTPSAVYTAVQAAVDKLKIIMLRLTCPSMSIRADTADGVTFKVTMKR